MAKRPVFVSETGPPYVSAILLEFEWHPGLSITQKRRSVTALHQSAGRHGISPVLEVSTRSEVQLGVELSAFNLQVALSTRKSSVSVECAFQSSKIFRDGGPFEDLLDASSSEAKRDPRVQASGPLIGFRLGQDEWPLEPPTVFYDWLYLQALHNQPELVSAIQAYSGFTDIEFNPEKSINCQARSVALYVALQRIGIVDRVVASRSEFLALLNGIRPPVAPPTAYSQGSLF